MAAVTDIGDVTVSAGNVAFRPGTLSISTASATSVSGLDVYSGSSGVIQGRVQAGSMNSNLLTTFTGTTVLLQVHVTRITFVLPK